MSRDSDTLKVGDPGPPFTLRTQRGQQRSLAECLVQGPVLLAFHRGTW